MILVKRYWFPVTVVILSAIIGCNFYTIFSSRGNESEEGAGTRVLTLSVSAKDTNASLNGEALRKALESFSPVRKAELKVEKAPGREALVLTVAEPVKLSELKERLDWQDSVLVEEETALDGELRIQVSGERDTALEKALRGGIGGLEGLEVVKVDLAGDEQSVTLRSAASATISKLRQAVEKAEFQLEDIEWPAMGGGARTTPVEGSSSKHDEGSGSK